jgi:hypothetical protein
MSWTKIEFYEDGKIKSVEMHGSLLQGKINYPAKEKK